MVLLSWFLSVQPVDGARQKAGLQTDPGLPVGEGLGARLGVGCGLGWPADGDALAAGIGLGGTGLAGPKLGAGVVWVPPPVPVPLPIAANTTATPDIKMSNATTAPAIRPTGSRRSVSGW